MKANKLPLVINVALALFIIVVAVITMVNHRQKIAEYNQQIVVVQEKTQMKATPIKFTSQENGGKLEYIVSVLGGIVVDNAGNTMENQILFSVSKVSRLSRNKNNVVSVRLEAIAETAKEEIRKDPISLPEVIYASVEYVAKKEFTINAAKTRRAFKTALKDYEKSVKEANDLVSVLGFQVVAEEGYVFHGGKTK